jgi:hypothetical protein
LFPTANHEDTKTARNFIWAPSPITDFGQILAVGADVFLVLQQLVAQELFEIRRPRAELWQTVDHVADQVKTIQVVEHRHVERRSDRAFFLVAALNRSRRLGRDVAGNAAWETELPEQLLQSRFAMRDLRIDLAVRAFEVDIGHQRGPAVTGAGDVDHVQVVLLDYAVEMNVDKILFRRRTPVPKQARLNVLEFERLAEERIVIQIDLPPRQVIFAAR